MVMKAFFKKLFCNHGELIKEETQVIVKRDDRIGTKVSLMCLKCGYHTNFWKYLEGNSYESEK
jgi:RNase P subunit RPR2